MNRKNSWKFPKGAAGYLQAMKRWTVIRTVMMTGLALGIYAVGYLTVNPHSNQNPLTVVAILGLLPASKSAVNMILFWLVKYAAKDLTEQVNAHAGWLQTGFDCIFTTYEKTFFVPALAVTKDHLCVYVDDPKLEPKPFKIYLEETLQKKQFHVSVAVFTELPKYLARLDVLSKTHSADEESGQIFELLKLVML